MESIGHKIPLNLFANTTTSYKFFWWLSILELCNFTEDTSWTFQRIISKMIANTSMITFKYSISFGGPDQLPRITKLLNDYLGTVYNSELLYKKLIERNSDKRIKRLLAYFYENVPYRFLTPWVGTDISRSDLADRETMIGIDAPYFVKGREIELSPIWVSYIHENYNPLRKHVLDEMSYYLTSRNPKLPITRQNIIDCFTPCYNASLNEANNEENTHVPTDTKIDCPIKNGKVCMITDTNLINDIKEIAAKDKIAAIAILTKHYENVPGIIMTLKEWANLVNSICEN